MRHRQLVSDAASLSSTAETDPTDEPDMTKWTTQLAFRLSG
jgi:hypothetical protein